MDPEDEKAAATLAGLVAVLDGAKASKKTAEEAAAAAVSDESAAKASLAESVSKVSRAEETLSAARWDAMTLEERAASRAASLEAAEEALLVAEKAHSAAAAGDGASMDISPWGDATAGAFSEDSASPFR